jgi:hypothetical protein
LQKLQGFVTGLFAFCFFIGVFVHNVRPHVGKDVIVNLNT